MRDTQIGLLIATPLIAIMAVRLYYIGALRLGGLFAVCAVAIGIAAVLFFSH